jgi:glycosyltransferase involved in cell wall biosynthesis
MAGPDEYMTLIHLTTVPVSLWGMLRGRSAYMRPRGIQIIGISSSGEHLEKYGRHEHAEVYAVEMQRRITPLSDLAAIWRLWRLFRKIRPTIVHAHTPKGGLLGMIAAWLARVPVRIYQCHGLPLMTAGGVRLVVLRLSEWTSCALSHRTLVVSHSIRGILIAERLCPEWKVAVPAGGSSNGIDSEATFNPDRLPSSASTSFRDAHSIPREALTLVFVGRIARDKGVVELAEAWRRLRESHPTLHLVLVGQAEPNDPPPEQLMDALRSDPRVHFAGRVERMPAAYAAADIVALPSYREGLSLTPLEAGAMRRPVVATRIPGIVDSVIDGVTGLLVPAGDAVALADAIETYINAPELRRQHGEAGREQVKHEYRQEEVWESVYQEYCRLLEKRGIAIPRPQSNAQSTLGQWEGNATRAQTPH